MKTVIPQPELFVAKMRLYLRLPKGEYNWYKEFSLSTAATHRSKSIIADSYKKTIKKTTQLRFKKAHKISSQKTARRDFQKGWRMVQIERFERQKYRSVHQTYVRTLLA